MLGTKLTGVAMLEMLLVLTLLASGLSAMLKIHTHNEVMWQRFTNTYCAHLKSSENTAQSRLLGKGIEVDWNNDWLRQCGIGATPGYKTPL